MARIIMVGECPSCGTKVVSRYPFEIGICKCENPHVEVPLELAIILPPRYLRKIERVSKYSGVPVEKLVEALLEETAEAVKRGLKHKL